MRSPALEKIAVTVAARSRSRPHGTPAPLAEDRASLDSIGSMVPVAAGSVVEEVRANGVTCEWISLPDADTRGAIMWLHGGWYALGSRSSHRPMLSRLAAATGMRVLSIDYALAPEQPYPQALDDALAAWRWLRAADHEPCVLGGDSAGGGLTLATMVRLREAAEPLPACAICLSPVVDLAATGESLRGDGTRDPTARADDLRHYASLYLAGRDPRTPHASPLYADLRGLPPLLVQVGADELLLDDSSRIAERARAAGVDVTLEVVPDVIHGWQLFAGLAAEGDAAIAGIAEFCGRYSDSRRMVNVTLSPA